MIFLLWLFPVWLNGQSLTTGGIRYNDDGSVTFSFNKPDSKRMRVYCDCALGDKKYNIKREHLQSARMKRDSNGVFTLTTPPLPPELYTYQFKSQGHRFVDPANADSIWIMSSKRSIFVRPGSPVSDLCLNDSLHGRTELFDFEDSVSKKTRRIFLYLPPGYDDNTDTYPVLYLLHGIHGYEKSWQDKGRAVLMVDKLIRQGKIAPMIVVMPDANPRELIGQKDDISMLRNLLHYGSWLRLDFERVFLTMDSQLSERYRISPDRSLRAIAGLSAGATQSANLANMYANHFQYVGLFSAIIHRKQLPTNNATIYWIGSGKADIFYPQSLHFVKKSKKLRITYIYYETSGGHTWRNWRLYLSEYLQFIFKNDKK